MRTPYWLAIVLYAGCGGSVETRTNPSPEGQDSGPAGASGTGGAAPDAGSAGAKADAAKICGGLAGVVCSADEWCDYTYAGINDCGGDDSTGICEQRTTGCPSDCPGTCGCDGKFYCNACMAHAAGTDDGAPGPCTTSPDGGPGDCNQAIAAVAVQVTDLACTAVVRLDYLQKSLIGYQILCGGLNTIDEANARSVSQNDTGFGQSGASLAGANPNDEYVFYEAPGDYGGAGVVSATRGTSVFGGSIIWMGVGEITWPKGPWQTPDKLGGAECSVQMWPKWRGFNLESGMEDSSAEAQNALQVAWNTALPAGMSSVQTVTGAVVLLYPRQTSMFNPANAEWIVLLNSRSME